MPSLKLCLSLRTQIWGSSNLGGYSTADPIHKSQTKTLPHWARTLVKVVVVLNLPLWRLKLSSIEFKVTIYKRADLSVNGTIKHSWAFDFFHKSFGGGSSRMHIKIALGRSRIDWEVIPGHLWSLQQRWRYSGTRSLLLKVTQADFRKEVKFFRLKAIALNPSHHKFCLCLGSDKLI